ncbi:MAG: type I-U CRISPR-associated RAMP protein Csb1/Cas7u [Myxococcota bacterium]|nr:type I-U CRISPR-associated RAMP protein Csb1/Cas7u [Myxococcota bacterium]
MRTIELAELMSAVKGQAAAIRCVTRLEPAGGPGEKIFPPTYVKDGNSETKYAFEQRRVGEREVKTVLLDSVASQANRFEEALLEGWRRKELDFPVVAVDFREVDGLKDLDWITALQAPHRIADALLRDSLQDGVPFRHTEAGRAFTDSRPANATGMYKHCPTALVFGVWDSTGPKGGLGAKFQRALVSEIVGIDAISGVKTASRIDPAGIEKKAGEVYKHADPRHEWTTDPDEAAKDPKTKKPVLVGKKGTPAEVNHGNIPPSIDRESGGVTVSHAVQTTVLSLPALRRLRFVTTSSGEPIPAEGRDAAEASARTALAALALAALAYQRENGYDLRSRSLLVPKDPFAIEIVPRDGGEPSKHELTRPVAAQLLACAETEARKHGLGWQRGPLLLKPAPKLAQLIRRSRELQAAGEVVAS